MKTAMPQIIRRPEYLLSDDKRVITRFFAFSPQRTQAILARAMAVKEPQVSELLAEAMEKFSWRHRDLRVILLRNCAHVGRITGETMQGFSEQRKLLIGAYFSLEYSIESAALFNPSIVLHPDQPSDQPTYPLRFLLSLRATGEGHISSIVFRSGTIHADGTIELAPPTRYADWARPEPYKNYDRRSFVRKLLRIQGHLAVVRRIVDDLPDPFTLVELEDTIAKLSKDPDRPYGFEQVTADVLWLANAHYTLSFPPRLPADERVIFPATRHESLGMEDVRLVRFVDDDQSVTYYGTYTAYDGSRMMPMLLDTQDFTHFHIRPLSGEFACNKGMALFPRRINGQYMMVSRHDGENLYLLTSDNLNFWNHSALLQRPVEPWELVQIGNSGSPIETDAGWLLLTHGVGPMREYGIGAMLLDRRNPRHILGRLREPLLLPTAREREGYVPNVVYSCGSLIHDDQLVIPYAMSDSATTFAIGSLSELIALLLEQGP